MNKLLTKIVGVALGVGLATGVATGVVVGSREVSRADAAEQVFYTLTPASGSNNSYAGNCDVTIGGITWNLTGNSTIQPWRIGGKSLSSVERTVYSKTPMGSAITKVELTVGAASSITVNSLELIVGDDDFTPATDTVSGTFAANSTITFTPTSGTSWATGLYYKFLFNVSVSGTSNKFVEFSEAKFYCDASGPVAVTGVTLDKTAAFMHVGGNLSLTATVSPETATNKTISWSSSDTGVATVSDGVVTPVGPGSTTITVTTEDGGKTVSCSLTVFAANHGLVENDPLTIAEAITIAKTLASGTQTTNQYYISGEVSSIQTAYSEVYGNISLNFTSVTDTFVGYRLNVAKAYGEGIAVDDTILMKGYITNYKGTYETSQGGDIITGTTYPEPALINGTLAQLFANTDGNHKQRYQITGIVSAWYGSNSNGTKYGNFYLQDSGNTSVSYYIYGATATSSALSWNEYSGVYSFVNQENFLTDSLTKDIAIGDSVTMILTRCDHTANEVTTPEACGIVLSVSHNVVSYSGQYVLTSEGSYTASGVTHNYKVEFNGVSSSLGADSSYAFSAKCLVVFTISDADNSGEYYISYNDNGTDQYLNKN